MASLFGYLLIENILVWGLGSLTLYFLIGVSKAIYYYGRDQANSDDNAACFAAFETANVKYTAIATL